MKESFEEESGDTLLVKASSPVEGLIALEKGLVDVATSAHKTLDEMIVEAKEKGVTVDPASLDSSVISKTSTVIFIHKPSNVDSLSKEQLKGIFSGKITNWQELGDQDLPIDVIWGSKTPGQNALFSKLIMDGEPITPKATPATDYDNIRELVMKRPGAIGIDSKGLKLGAVKVPSTPPINSSIIVVTRKPLSAKAKKLLDFVQLSLFELGH